MITHKSRTVREMASVRKHGNGWRVHIDRKGIRKSKTFPTRQAAKDWAAHQEYLILNRQTIVSRTPLSEVFLRYAREVSPDKRGHRWEEIRLERLSKDPLIKSIAMQDLEPSHFAEWRDARKKEVSDATVRREMQLINSVLNTAKREWGMIASNPLEGVRKPAPSKPRDRLPTIDEIERLLFVAGTDLTKATARTIHAFLFACESAMRAGEIAGLTWDNFDLVSRVAHLPITKNGHPRDVPLTARAVELIELLPKQDPVFGLKSSQIDALFRQVKKKAMIEGLRFHDSRAEALTRLSRKVDVLTLAKISGHRDLRILSNTYYRETAAEIAKRI